MYEEKRLITYYDLDMLGRVKLSALLRMVHVAADANTTALGASFKVMTSHSLTFILQRFAIRMLRMPQYGETVTLRTWPDCVVRGTFSRKSDMYDESGKKIMECASLWIAFDYAARKILRPAALPIEIPNIGAQGVDLQAKKVLLPSAGELPSSSAPADVATHTEFSRHTHTVRYADTDTNRHMNNSIYGDVIENALFPTMANVEAAQNALPWREVQINYLAEARLGDEIDVVAWASSANRTVAGTVNGRTSFVASVC